MLRKPIWNYLWEQYKAHKKQILSQRDLETHRRLESLACVVKAKKKYLTEKEAHHDLAKLISDGKQSNRRQPSYTIAD
jgi:hypothetical protein